MKSLHALVCKDQGMVLAYQVCIPDVFVWMAGSQDVQFCLYLVVCAVRAQSVFSWEPGLSVASLLDGQAVFAESVSGQGFPQFCVGHSGQVFCHSVVSVK